MNSIHENMDGPWIIWLMDFPMFIYQLNIALSPHTCLAIKNSSEEKEIHFFQRDMLSFF